MSAKLTLRLDEQLIAAAKNHARANGRSVSALVADYFAQLSRQTQPRPRSSAKTITSQLRGALKGAAASEVDHQIHLATKHQ